MIGNIKKNYFVLISTSLFLYFFFNLFDGERGLISYYEKKRIKTQLLHEKELIASKLSFFEKNNNLLTDSIDLDYLEILYRKKFVVGKSTEKIYINY